MTGATSGLTEQDPGTRGRLQPIFLPGYPTNLLKGICFYIIEQIIHDRGACFASVVN
jgi:hypothetical protein